MTGAGCNRKYWIRHERNLLACHPLHWSFPLALSWVRSLPDPKPIGLLQWHRKASDMLLGLTHPGVDATTKSVAKIFACFGWQKKCSLMSWYLRSTSTDLGRKGKTRSILHF